MGTSRWHRHRAHMNTMTSKIRLRIVQNCVAALSWHLLPFIQVPPGPILSAEESKGPSVAVTAVRRAMALASPYSTKTLLATVQLVLNTKRPIELDQADFASQIENISHGHYWSTERSTVAKEEEKYRDILSDSQVLDDRS